MWPCPGRHRLWVLIIWLDKPPKEKVQHALQPTKSHKFVAWFQVEKYQGLQPWRWKNQHTGCLIPTAFTIYKSNIHCVACRGTFKSSMFQLGSGRMLPRFEPSWSTSHDLITKMPYVPMFPHSPTVVHDFSPWFGRLAIWPVSLSFFQIWGWPMGGNPQMWWLILATTSISSCCLYCPILKMTINWKKLNLIVGWSHFTASWLVLCKPF